MPEEGSYHSAWKVSLRVTPTRSGRPVVFHGEMSELLRSCPGHVIVSGYACRLYVDLYERHGWQRVDTVAQTNSGGNRVESLWLSPRTVDALARPAQAGLFAAVSA